MSEHNIDPDVQFIMDGIPFAERKVKSHRTTINGILIGLGSETRAIPPDTEEPLAPITPLESNDPDEMMGKLNEVVGRVNLVLAETE